MNIQIATSNLIEVDNSKPTSEQEQIKCFKYSNIILNQIYKSKIFQIFKYSIESNL